MGTLCPDIMDALQPEHLCDNLIGLIGPDVHLEGGGWLKEFPHSR